MTLLTEPTRIVLAKDYTLPDDADAVAYIAAVEAADGQALETATRMAINAFIKGCKADGIWPAIKASCILAGARTLNGALVPLVGTAPTNFNFVSGDYNRKTGLVGDGSTKYLDSNRNNNADPQDNKHLAVFQSTHATRNANRGVLGTAAVNGGSHLLTLEGPSRRFFRVQYSTIFAVIDELTSPGFWGASRISSATVNCRYNGSSFVISDPSNTVIAAQQTVFARGSTDFADARLAFYSIGESLDLALLDARVTTLINAFGAAIP